MIVYLDSSVLLKRYVRELGSDEVDALMSRARVVGTSAMSQVEIVAALARGIRGKLLTRTEGTRAMEVFREEWGRLNRLRVTELPVNYASELAREHGLRGYDAVHLASALLWRGLLGDQIHLATYDRALWNAARRAGFEVFPAAKPSGATPPR